MLAGQAPKKVAGRTKHESRPEARPIIAANVKVADELQKLVVNTGYAAAFN